MLGMMMWRVIVLSRSPLLTPCSSGSFWLRHRCRFHLKKLRRWLAHMNYDNRRLCTLRPCPSLLRPLLLFETARWSLRWHFDVLVDMLVEAGKSSRRSIRHVHASSDEWGEWGALSIGQLRFEASRLTRPPHDLRRNNYPVHAHDARTTCHLSWYCNFCGDSCISWHGHITRDLPGIDDALTKHGLMKRAGSTLCASLMNRRL
jgi:hypothetical protein